jgi:hypothetical protein
MPRKGVETSARSFLIRCGFKSDFPWSKAAAEHICGPMLQFLRPRDDNFVCRDHGLSSVTNGGPRACRLQDEPCLFNDFPRFSLPVDTPPFHWIIFGRA